MLVTDPNIVLPWVAERIEAPIPINAVGIGQESGGRIVAGVIYESYTGTSIAASIAVEEGESVSRQMLWAIFDYPFNQLGVKKILTYSRNCNHKVQVMLDKLGFTEEATIEDVYEDGALVIRSMTREQCKWLGEDDARQKD
jgi:RimJ/RimL family protein N-acetyltransferase